MTRQKRFNMYQEILKFWFDDIGQTKWWVSNAELDPIIDQSS